MGNRQRAIINALAVPLMILGRRGPARGETGALGKHGRMKHIVLLVHERDPLEFSYFLYELASIWRAEGMRVSVRPGLLPPVEAELAILHVDLTWVPPEYQALCQQYPRVLNATVADISKRTISRHLVTAPDGDWQGPVVVKTDRNYGGVPESVRFGNAWSRFRASRRVNYRVYRTPRQVPRRLWSDEDWVVERFLPERSGSHYCLRTYTFLGDAYTHSRCFANVPIIKSWAVVGREDLGEPPPELVALRRAMQMEYGKLDYALVDGKVVLYDVNKTPSFGALAPERARAIVGGLARGVDGFLASRAA